MSEGLLYEPRSLWSIGYVTRTGNDPGVVLRLPRHHFYNGERHPVTLQRIAISPINYLVRDMAEGNQPAAARPLPFYGQSVINRIGVSISSPFRQHYSGSQEFALASLAPLPTALPPMYRASATATNVDSSIWGVSALNFDQPLYVPRDGSIEWDVSPVPLMSNDGETTISGVIVGYMLLQESGGDFAGNTRGEGWGYIPRLTTAATPAAQRDDHFPFVRDPVSSIVGLPVVGAASVKGTDTTGDPWLVSRVTAAGDRDNIHIGADSFKSQAKNAAGSSKFTGMRIMYDQIDHDNELDTAYPNDPKAQVCTQIGTRVKSTSGSGIWWWRPGAPIALVCDSITPALVYNLPAPITLGPGDSLDVRLSFPGVADSQIGEDIPFQVGVSLNGFTAIEG